MRSGMVHIDGRRGKSKMRREDACRGRKRESKDARE